MVYLKPFLFILVLSTLATFAAIGCKSDESTATPPPIPAPPPSSSPAEQARSTAEAPIVEVNPTAEMQRGQAPPAFSSMQVGKPTPRPTPNLDATVAAEVQIRLQIEEQVRATLETGVTPVPTEPPPKGLLLEVEQIQEPIVAGADVHIEFSITNQLSNPIHEVNVEFLVTGAGHVSYIYAEREGCRVAVCSFRTLDDNEVVTGQISLDSEISLDMFINLELVASWHLQNSEARPSNASASMEIVHDDSPGMLLWSTPVQVSQMECGKGIDVDADAVYAAFGDTLVALSRTEGELLWTADAGGQVYDPVSVDGSVLVQVTSKEGDDGDQDFVRSLDAMTGYVNWEHRAAGRVKGPHLVYGDEIYFVDYVGQAGPAERFSSLVSLEAPTGNLNWRHRFDGEATTGAVESDGYIYLSTSEPGPNYLYVLDPSERKLIRFYETGIQAAYNPLVFEGHAYLVSSEGSFHSFDLSEGNHRWRFAHPDKMTGTPLQADRFVFVAAEAEGERDARFLYGVVIETGKWGWAFGVSSRRDSASVSGDKVYAIGPQDLKSMDAGKLDNNWQGKYGEICGPVTVHDGVLYGRTAWGNEHLVFALRGD